MLMTFDLWPTDLGRGVGGHAREGDEADPLACAEDEDGGQHLAQAQHLVPNHQRWYAEWRLSRNTYTLHARFCTFGADLHAQSVLGNKISASELRRKFIKSVLLAGWHEHSADHHAWHAETFGVCFLAKSAQKKSLLNRGSLTKSMFTKFNIFLDPLSSGQE